MVRLLSQARINVSATGVGMKFNSQRVRKNIFQGQTQSKKEESIRQDTKEWKAGKRK